MTAVAEFTTRRPRDRALISRGVAMDVAMATSILLIAAYFRLVNLDRYTVSYPEGIRAEQLMLMAAGYRPCVEIFCNQGPLLFYALYPTFLLFGQTLEAVRSGVILFSFAAIAATYWVGRLVGGRAAGASAALLVALSPTFLKFSRLGLAEVPAEAPAIAAVGAAIVFCRGGRLRWLIAASLLVALSLLLKPVTLAVCAPVGLLVLARPERRWRNVGLLIAVTAVAIAIPTFAIGFSEILEQVVAFRLRSRVAEGRGVDWNLMRIVEEVAQDRLGLFAFGAAGATVTAIRLGWGSIPLLVWPIASLVLLLVHTPLHGKHVVTLIPPVALLAGAGLALAWPTSADPPGRLGALLRGRLTILAAFGVVAYAASLPGVASRDLQLAWDPEPLENDPAAYWYDEVISTLRATTGRQDVIVTDHPYLTFQARRLVPPPLVESSVTRILASSLTAEDAILEAQRYDTRAVLLWADKLTTMRQFKAWVDRAYVPVRVYAADKEATPTLYLRAERVPEARGILDALTPRKVDAEFSGGMRLVSYGLDDERVRAGDRTAVNLTWEAAARPAADFRASIQLRAGDRVLWNSDDLPIGGAGPGTRSWSPGDRVSLSALVTLPRQAAPGTYNVSVRLVDPRAGRPLGPLNASDDGDGADPKGVNLGAITVLAVR